MIGFSGRPDWWDLSDFVVHFTKGDINQGYNTILSILYNQVLLRGPGNFGFARNVYGLADTQRAVCFSEIPLGVLHRLVDRRNSPYGIGFRKRHILNEGGGPIWYLEDKTLQHKAFQQLVNQAISKGIDINDSIWKLTPFVDAPSGPRSMYQYDFRWEREWRICKDLHFRIPDVAFLLIPEEHHANAQAFFQDHVQNNSGPGYFCPYVDPRWDVQRVANAIGPLMAQPMNT